MNPLRERLLITLIRANRKQGFSTAQLYKPSLRLFVGRVTFSFPYVNGGGVICKYPKLGYLCQLCLQKRCTSARRLDSSS